MKIFTFFFYISALPIACTPISEKEIMFLNSIKPENDANSVAGKHTILGDDERKTLLRREVKDGLLPEEKSLRAPSTTFSIKGNKLVESPSTNQHKLFKRTPGWTEADYAIAQTLYKKLHFMQYPEDAPEVVQTLWREHRAAIEARQTAKDAVLAAEGGSEASHLVPPKHYISLTPEEFKKVKAAAQQKKIPDGRSWWEAALDYFSTPPNAGNSNIARNTNPEG